MRSRSKSTGRFAAGKGSRFAVFAVVASTLTVAGFGARLDDGTAATLSPDLLLKRIYEGGRAERLVALEAAAYTSDPWPVLPYLAALMGARDRGTASRSARALVKCLSMSAAAPYRDSEVVSGEAAQLAEQLHEIAGDARLDADIRASAVHGIGILAAFERNAAARVKDLLSDDEIEVRRSAFGLVTPPVADDLLKEVAKMAKIDADKGLRAQAAALLCENALAHGVKAPSSDLTEILKAALGDQETPAEGAASILICISNFERASTADLIDLALKNPDSSVLEFWEGRDEQLKR